MTEIDNIIFDVFSSVLEHPTCMQMRLKVNVFFPLSLGMRQELLKLFNLPLERILSSQFENKHPQLIGKVPEIFHSFHLESYTFPYIHLFCTQYMTGSTKRFILEFNFNRQIIVEPRLYIVRVRTPQTLPRNSMNSRRNPLRQEPG